MPCPNNSFLNAIDSPQDIKALSVEELQFLANEIRERIMEVLSLKGGHLASNLGIVELTLALHFVFSSPHDKLLFDTSHQSYTHKLLTGRNPRFSQLRQYQGLSGFSHPKESPHDLFFSGHSGTALSLALGLAKGRDLSKKKEHILPILGDGSLTCGLTLEALNNIPKDLSRFIVILNDNEMAISKNVGNISLLLSRLINNPTSNKLYQEIQKLLSKIPGCGPLLANQGKKITESLKNLVSPSSFFEPFGLSYVGPIDGHNLPKLIETFSALKNTLKPVIVHVMTQKGKGMDAALKNPTLYHGVKPLFSEKPSSSITFSKIFGEWVSENLKKDPHLVVITPAMAEGSGLGPLLKTFPNRCMDVGIAEGHAVTFAGGLSFRNNQKVIVSIYASFLLRALDNVFHDISLQESPVVFAIDRTGLNGPDGCTHHGIYDIGFLNSLPNLVIASPRNGRLLKELLESAFSWKKPVAIRYPNQETEESKEPLQYRKMGKGEILIKGEDLLLIASGTFCEKALKVCALLQERGIEATVVDPIFFKPLDLELFSELIPQYPLIATLEDHALSSGLGAIVNSFILQNSFHPQKVLNFAIPDTFVQQGKNEELYKELGLDAESIAFKIEKEWEKVGSSFFFKESTIKK